MQKFLSFQMVLIETTKVLTYILVCIFSMYVYNYNGIFKFTVRSLKPPQIPKKRLSLHLSINNVSLEFIYILLSIINIQFNSKKLYWNI